VIQADDRPEEMPAPPTPGALDLPAAMPKTEKATILAAMSECNHHGGRTTQLLGISGRALRIR
jgi:two-component system NtrC family response regulator